MRRKSNKVEDRLGFGEEGIKYIAELLSITTRMLSAFNLEKLLGQILDTSLEFLRADTGSLMLVEEDNSTLKIKVARGLSKEVVEKVSIKVGEKVAGWVAKEGKPLLLIGGLKADPRFRHLDEKKEIKSSICVPLKVEKRVIGVLNINNVYAKSVFSDLDLKVLSLLANQAAISIWSVRLYEDAKKANSELLMTQRQLVAREKMAALGQLSAGVAHEINNPLTAILANVQYVMSNMTEGSFGWEELREIKEATELASRIIQRLFNYCRPSDYKRQAVDINDNIKRVITLVEHQMERQHIKIDLNLTPAPLIVTINPDELKELILNIVLNAKSAMPDGGALVMTTRGSHEDNFVEIEFADTGCGMPEKILGKIFDPFFTTGRPGSAGLGLSICQRIVSNYGGAINVESQPGKGTVFTVRLPAASEARQRKG